MNRDFIVKMTPRNCRLLMLAMDSSHVEIDPKIMMEAKKDRVPPKDMEAFEIDLDNKQRELIQFLHDFRFRASVPYDFDGIEVFKAVLVALKLAGEEKVLLYGANDMIKETIDVLLKLQQPIVSVELNRADPSEVSWKNCKATANHEDLMPFRDHVLVSGRVSDPLIGKLFPKVISIEKMSQQGVFDLEALTQSMSICSARQSAAMLYPAIVEKMPSGKQNANYKRRGHSLFPLMGTFTKYLAAETK